MYMQYGNLILNATLTVTLTGDLNEQESVLHENCDAFGVAGLEVNAGRDHAEDGVDVGADDGHARQEA